MRFYDIKTEIERIAERISDHCLEILANPERINEKLEFSLKVGTLSDEQLLELEDFMCEVSEAYAGDEYPVEEHYGTYYDDAGLLTRVHLRKEVAHEELPDVYDYDNGVLVFNIPFNFIYFEISADNFCEISESQYSAIVEDFSEMSEEEYEDFYEDD